MKLAQYDWLKNSQAWEDIYLGFVKHLEASKQKKKSLQSYCLVQESGKSAGAINVTTNLFFSK